MMKLILILALNSGVLLQMGNAKALNGESRRTYSDQLYFPQDPRYQFEIDQIFRIQRAINAQTKEQRITPKLRVPIPQPLIFFDEDDNEPLAPEPKFEIRMGRPRPTPTKKPEMTVSTSTPTMALVPRWPPMDIDPTKNVVTTPRSKVTFFPSSSNTAKPSSPPGKGPDKTIILTSPKPPTPSKTVPQGKTTPSIKKPSMSTSTTVTPPKISEIGNGLGEHDAFLGGSFYVPFIKTQNKKRQTRYN